MSCININIPRNWLLYNVKWQGGRIFRSIRSSFFSVVSTRKFYIKTSLLTQPPRLENTNTDFFFFFREGEGGWTRWGPNPRVLCVYVCCIYMQTPLSMSPTLKQNRTPDKNNPSASPCCVEFAPIPTLFGFFFFLLCISGISFFQFYFQPNTKRIMKVMKIWFSPLVFIILSSSFMYLFGRSFDLIHRAARGETKEVVEKG